MPEALKGRSQAGPKGHQLEVGASSSCMTIIPSEDQNAAFPPLPTPTYPALYVSIGPRVGGQIGIKMDGPWPVTIDLSAGALAG